jgi:hypothetical protein
VKKPIVPTWSVIQIANFCRRLRFSLRTSLTLRMGLRSRFNSFRVGILDLSGCMVMGKVYLKMARFINESILFVLSCYFSVLKTPTFKSNCLITLIILPHRTLSNSVIIKISTDLIHQIAGA